MAKVGKRSLLGGAFVFVFGALCAFMSWTLRDQVDATKLALITRVHVAGTEARYP